MLQSKIIKIWSEIIQFLFQLAVGQVNINVCWSLSMVYGTLFVDMDMWYLCLSVKLSQKFGHAFLVEIASLFMLHN